MDKQPLFPIGSSSVPSSESPSPLFPIGNRTGSQALEAHGALTWLSNPSFSESLLPAPTSTSEWRVEGVEVQKQLQEHVSVVDGDELLATSSEQSDEDGEHSKSVDRTEKTNGKSERKKEKKCRYGRKKDKKQKKAKVQEADDKQIGALDGMQLKRKSDASRWVEIKTKEYYFDTHGDRDNLAFGSLYRMDVARFQRHLTSLGTKKHKKGLHNVCGFMHLEEDEAALEENVKMEGRYWSAKNVYLERRKDLRRLRITLHSPKLKGRKSLSVPSGDFICTDDADILQKEDGNQTLREESWDDYIVRKTREFNQLTRERPHDESLWIAFANFQDELIKVASGKAVLQNAVEKKIAVLEKALEFHPSSEDLLLLFLNSCRKKDMTPSLISKWEHVIKHNPGSYKLWREYIRFRRGEFSLFTVSSLRKLHIQALQVFAAAHNNYQSEGEMGQMAGISKGSDVETEKNLISLFVDLCRFEWQTGYHELAVSMFQAQIEYNIFAPPIIINERNKKRLFKEFWDSGAPRVGEDGAAGWAAWLQKEEEHLRDLMSGSDNSAEHEEATEGGWTGWSEPFSKDVKAEEEPHPSPETNLELDDETADMKDTEDDENEALLLERLGLSLDSKQDVEVKDSSTWKRWSEEEERRDCAQWLPVHPNNLNTIQDDEILREAEGDDEQLERAVLFEDIRECLLSINSAGAHLDLLEHFIDFCDGPYPQWCCSNSMKWKERMESLENLFGTFLDEVLNTTSYVESSHHKNIIRNLVGGRAWTHESEGRPRFLCNTMILCRPLFSQSFRLQEKLLMVDHHKISTDEKNAQASGSRILAKKLLRSDRQAVLLWGAYACVEATAGNIEVAQKVFDTTLTSLSSLSEEIQLYAPILYLAYVDMELSHSSSVRKNQAVFEHQKVLHLLSCLGCGIPYTPFTLGSLVSSTQLLKAKCGYKDQLQKLRKGRLQGDLSDEAAALIACAVLFQLHIDGFEAASLLFEDSLAISLPGKRQQSLQFELLHVRLINILDRDKKALKPKTVRHSISRGLAQYPNNPQLLSAFIRCSSLSTGTNDLRQFYDDALKRHPSTVLSLFALSIEFRKLGSGARIHSLFERALENSDTQQSVVLWRCYLAYELQVRGNPDAARRVFFRAIHACPWSKVLWLDGFQKMSTVLSAKELSEFQEIMRDKELRLRTDVYEILLEDEEME